MNDKEVYLDDLKKEVKALVQEREWKQFHNPKNLSMALVTEAAELMDVFRWCDESNAFDCFKHSRKEVEHELADVLITTLAFANAIDVDLVTLFKQKMKEIKQKYSVEQSKGRPLKYTAYKK